MGYTMKTNLSNRNNYGNKRDVDKIKYIVIHFTANDGDSDEGNGNYFHNNVVKASAHYFVDDDSVTESVPVDYIAYSVGGNKWDDCVKTGGGKLYGIANNANSISIEMCDSKKDGKVMATEKTIENTVSLCKTLMKKYNVDLEHVIRHFDVNGKHCPAYYMNEKAWSEFKKRFNTEVEKEETVMKESKKEETVKANNSYTVKINITNLRIRKGPGIDFNSVGYTGKGKFKIVEEASGKGSTKGWGKLKSGAGWISLDYAKKI